MRRYRLCHPRLVCGEMQGVKIFFKEGVSHFLDALPGSEGMKSFVWRGVTICLDLQGAGSFMQRRSSRILSCFT